MAVSPETKDSSSKYNGKRYTTLNDFYSLQIKILRGLSFVFNNKMIRILYLKSMHLPNPSDMSRM